MPLYCIILTAFIIEEFKPIFQTTLKFYYVPNVSYLKKEIVTSKLVHGQAIEKPTQHISFRYQNSC